MKASMTDRMVDRITCLGLARSVAPEDTGNLKFNAMSANATSDGFVITYSLKDAYYIYFLEEGTRFTTRHRGFIANKAVPMIADYLYSKYTAEDYGKALEYFHEGYVSNIDYAKRARMYDKWTSSLLNPTFKDLQGAYNVLERRELLRLDSTLANMVTQGHMSNVYDWKHESIENDVPDAFKKR